MNIKINLKEYVHPKMDVLFVALNAPEVSNANAHWFSYNLSFWNLLHRSRLITQPIFDPLDGDITVFADNKINYNKSVFGVTDLNREIVVTNSRHVSTNMSHVHRILTILENNLTKKLCLMHSMVAEEFEKNGIISRNNKHSSNQFGIVGKYNSTVIYEVPFHSGNSIPNKERFYSKLSN